VGFELVGHTHEDVDQMFSRFSWAMKNADCRSVEEMAKVILKSYAPTPHVEMIDHTVNWDLFKDTLGLGVLAGIQGEHGASQQEKIHFIKFKKVDGVVKMFWKCLADDPLWAPEGGRNIIRTFEWPFHIPTKPVKAATPELIAKLQSTMGLILDGYCPNSKEEVEKSWSTILQWMSDPPEVGESPTWEDFNTTFNITPLLCREAALNYVSPRGILSPKDVDERRQLMAGSTPEDSAEAERQLKMRAEGDEEEEQRLEVELAQAPDLLIQTGQQRSRDRVMNIRVGEFYAVLFDDDHGWWPAKCLDAQDLENIKFHFWMSRSAAKQKEKKHGGQLVPMTRRSGHPDYISYHPIEEVCKTVLVVSQSSRLDKKTVTSIMKEVQAYKETTRRVSEMATARAEKDAMLSQSEVER
jgi:hypothetical protein